MTQTKTTKLFLEMPDDSDSGTTAQFRIGTEKAIMKFDDETLVHLCLLLLAPSFFPKISMAQFCVKFVC